MTLPNFFIIGAAKCGTTALSQYLAQHPDVFMSSPKEPHFFAFMGESLDFRGPGVTVNSAITDIDSYLRIFENAGSARAIGEASVTSLYVPTASARIREYVPAAKLIVILRNPVERAFSSFQHLIRDGREPIADFEAALDAEPRRIRDNWGFLWRYADMGFYHRQLEPFFSLFPRTSIRTVLHEDLVRDSERTLRELFEFLGVDAAFTADTSVRHNVSGVPRLGFLHRALLGTTAIKGALHAVLPEKARVRAREWYLARALERQSMPLRSRERLKEVFASDVAKLAQLIDRDLSGWLGP